MNKTYVYLSQYLKHYVKLVYYYLLNPKSHFLSKEEDLVWHHNIVIAVSKDDKIFLCYFFSEIP